MSGKLVRDRIPEVMRADGIEPATRTLTGVEFFHALRAKLDEEIAEYDASLGYDAILDELADISEVVRALGDVCGISAESVEQARIEKKAARGGFLLGVWLEQP